MYVGTDSIGVAGEGVEMGQEKKEAIGLVQSEEGLGQDKAESCIFACIVGYNTYILQEGI